MINNPNTQLNGKTNDSENIRIPESKKKKNTEQQKQWGEKMLRKTLNQVNFELPFCVQEEGIINKIEAYRESKPKLCFYYLCVLLSGGLIYLLCRWVVNANLLFKFKAVKNDQKLSMNATHFLIYGHDKNVYLLIPAYKKKMRQLSQQEGEVSDQPEHIEYLYICFRLYDYYLSHTENTFRPIQTDFFQLSHAQIHKKYGNGIQGEQQLQDRILQFGNNNTQIPPKSICKTFIDQILSPFYIFQLYSVILWSIQGYVYYAGVIALSSIISITVTMKDTMTNYKNLRKMSYFETKVQVYRGIKNQIKLEEGNQYQPDETINNYKTQISSLELVPGDIIEIPENNFMPCDLILLNGQAVMVEAMLTGETVPIIKTSLPNNDNIYNPEQDGKQITLFSGTKCLETRFYKKGKVPILGLVTQTSFNTKKGSLVRSIMFPKPLSFNFYSDSMKFIAVLALLAVLGFFASLKFQLDGYYDGFYEAKDLILKQLDLITIAVPPALPTCLSIGISFAIRRLKKRQIYCISPLRVNICGQVTIMCFDKTGSLTEDGMDLNGVRTVHLNENKQLVFSSLETNAISLQSENHPQGNMSFPPRQTFWEMMAACHTLTKIQGNIVGDPLELKMFQASQWVLEEKELQSYNENVVAIVKPSQELKQLNPGMGILKRFEFSSNLQRMSVIVKRKNDSQFTLFTKGSPEKIQELCKKETIPQNFQKILDSYVQQGYRVLGFAMKQMPEKEKEVMTLERNIIELDLTFIGLLIMENKMKSQTPISIKQLHEANIKTIMVTGDNALTAIQVGRQSGIIPDKSRVYLGDIVENKQPDQKGNPVQNRPKIQWKYVQKTVNFQNENIKQDNPQQVISVNNSGDIINSEDLPFYKEDNYSLAITGNAFNLLLQDMKEGKEESENIFKVVIQKTLIYARMKPEQKALMVHHQQSQEKNQIVGMCGDGANDCTALQTANIGISLSDAEASIAAPFTSKIQDISCVVHLLIQGRAALVTSFQCFRFMALYSMIQFSTVSMLYFILSLPSDFQFLYWDVVIIIPLAFLLGFTEATEKLSKQVPNSKLITFPVLISVIGLGVIQDVFQILTLYILTQQSWYVSCPDTHEKYLKDLDDSGAQMKVCYEPTVLFWFSNFQYIIVCMVLSIGRPWRKPFYTNKPFSIALILIITISLIVQLVRYDGFETFFEYLLAVEPANSKMPSHIPALVLAFSAINGLVTFFYEKWICPFIIVGYYSLKKRKQRRNINNYMVQEVRKNGSTNYSENCRNITQPSPNIQPAM